MNSNRNPRQNAKEISIYAYDDFRVFLCDRYDALKHNDPNCTARFFAQKAGFSNPGFLNDVIKGKRTLSIDACIKLSVVFNFTDYERDFFNLLVEYGQSKKENEKHELYRKISARRNRSSFVKINPANTKYYQDFRYPLVFNALMACDFRGDYELLSNFIYPVIAPSQLKICVDHLCEWGLVIHKENGSFSVTSRFIEPPPTLKEHVRQLNREWILQAADALMKIPSDKRHMSTMLLSMSPATCKKITEKIEQFRQDIWKCVDEESEDPSVIMQLNLQYFPRSKKR